MSRLAAPWQLIRLATKAAGGDDANRIAETPYAVAVDIVLDEIDRRVRELAGDLKSGRGVAVSALLKEIHDAVRGLRSELDLPLEFGVGQAARRRARRNLQHADRRDRADVGPRAAPDAAAAVEGDRAGLRARCRRGGRDRGADRLRASPAATMPASLPSTRSRSASSTNCSNRSTPARARCSTRCAHASRRRARVPPVAGRCRGAVLRQGVRPGICRRC